MTKSWDKYFVHPPLEEIEKGRGSGRTTRMLRRALATALQGQTVFVLMAEFCHRAWMMPLLQKLPEFGKLYNVHVAYQSGDIQLPSGQIRFRGADSPDWDWHQGRFKGFPPGVPVFIDHDAWERELNKPVPKEKK